MREFWAKTAEIYAYTPLDELTQTVDVNRLPDNVRAEWNEILSRVSTVPVEEAIRIIRSYVTNRLRYRAFNDIERSAVESFKAYAAHGASSEADYLSFIMSCGGGKCVEFSEVTNALLRLAGIPTVMVAGYVAVGNRVTTEAHQVAAVVLPAEGQSGKFIFQPVETATNRLSGAVSAGLKKLWEALRSRLKPVSQKEPLKRAVEVQPQDPWQALNSQQRALAWRLVWALQADIELGIVYRRPPGFYNYDHPVAKPRLLAHSVADTFPANWPSPILAARIDSATDAVWNALKRNEITSLTYQYLQVEVARRVDAWMQFVIAQVVDRAVGSFFTHSRPSPPLRRRGYQN